MSTQTFAVTGLHCGGCVNTVRDAITALAGVEAVDVELQPKSASTVTVRADSPLDSAVIQQALAEQGEFHVV